MTEITLDAVRRSIKRIVEEAGDGYSYEKPLAAPRHTDRSQGSESGCYYVHDDQVPGCIVGKSLYEDFGWPLERLMDSEGRGAYHILNNKDKQAAQYLGIVQAQQDHGSTWADAYAKGEAWLENDCDSWVSYTP